MSRHFGGAGLGYQQDRNRVLVVLALLLFLIVAGGIVYLFASHSGVEPTPTSVVIQHEPAELKQVDVLVPLQKIESGTPLEPVFFNLERRTESAVSPRVVKGYEQIKGFYARSLIVPGEPLVSDLITPIRPTNAITANIPEGFRAVTISVNATSSVEGWALPGAKVDVVWASRIRGQPGVTVIVQNAKILSAERQVETNSKPGAPVPSTVTLLVTAEDASKIQLASTTGALSLSLRGDTDPGRGISSGSITVDDLLGRPTKATDLPRSAGVAVRVRGADGKMQEFVLEDGKLIPLAGEGERGAQGNEEAAAR